MKIIELKNIKESGRTYGGNAGRKLGIIYNGEYWFVKFPKNMQDFRKPQRSYTTTPLSEYLGSHIYESIGIPTHKTELCFIDNKIAVMCKDFKTSMEFQLQDFKSISNHYSSGTDEHNIQPHTSAKLSDIFDIMETNSYFQEMPKLKERFWNMFIVDALIGNNDRNAGNWGIIHNEITQQNEIAPVYDNGASFSTSMSVEQFRTLLNDEDKFIDSVYTKRVCAYTDENMRAINPLKYIENTDNEDCLNALVRIVKKINIDKIYDIIYDVPTSYNGLEVMPPEQKEFYSRCIQFRYEKVLIPAYQKVIEKYKDNNERTEINIEPDITDEY